MYYYLCRFEALSHIGSLTKQLIKDEHSTKRMNTRLIGEVIRSVAFLLNCFRMITSRLLSIAFLVFRSSEDVTQTIQQTPGNTPTENLQIITICSNCQYVLFSKDEGCLEFDNGSSWIPLTQFVREYKDTRNIVWSHGLCDGCYTKQNQMLESVERNIPSFGEYRMSLSTIPEEIPQSVLKRRTSLSSSASSSSSNSPDSSANNTPNRSRRRSILVVDDNALQRKIIKRMVERAGFECDVACGGDEALEMALESTYDVILMDCVMGDTDGWTAASKIRKLEGSLTSSQEDTRAYIVALTGLSSSPELALKCAQAGMDEVVNKPVSERYLHTLLSEKIAL